MCKPGIRIFLALAATLGSLFLVCPAFAQCIPGRPDFQNVSVERGNPFVADYSTTVKALPLLGIASLTHAGLRSVARDSEGRVRLESSAGKYKVRTAEGTETETERLLVSLCDPVSHTLVQLDSAIKTATVYHPRFNVPPQLKLDNHAQQTFCSRLFGMRRSLRHIQTEDLGHQIISGLDAQGLRFWFVPQGGGAQTSLPSSFNDLWCSDGLGVLVLQVFVSGGTHKNETLLQNIERREPDPALFEIPPDYTILERVADGNRPGFLRPLPTPSAPNNLQ